MQERPKINLPLKTSDKALEIVGWLFLIALWLLTIINYASLPDTIPIHFNATGQADGYGHKAVILGLPLIATVLFFGLTMLNKYPHIFNYPTNITPENTLQQYTYATRLIRYLKVIIVFIFGLIAFMIIQKADGESQQLENWFLPAVLGLIFVPLLFYFFQSFKSK